MVSQYTSTIFDIDISLQEVSSKLMSARSHIELSHIILQLGSGCQFMQAHQTYEDGDTYLAIWYLDKHDCV